jgi:hypothetical protein
MNHPLVLNQARALAARLEREAGDMPGRVDRACWLLYARPATAAEQEVAAGLLAAERSAGSDDAAAWTALAQVMLCANEFVYVD